ncbi:hypothetical protein EDB80DRAFT_737845 [Ilyonectria destructans]|nr:hypothetical protein EDB80DRAFT_737845 [Ilyonectria destructans]
MGGCVSYTADVPRSKCSNSQRIMKKGEGTGKRGRGGGAKHQNTKTPKRQNSKTPKLQNAKTPKRQNSKTPKRQNAKNKKVANAENAENARKCQKMPENVRKCQ